MTRVRPTVRRVLRSKARAEAAEAAEAVAEAMSADLAGKGEPRWMMRRLVPEGRLGQAKWTLRWAAAATVAQGVAAGGRRVPTEERRTGGTRPRRCRPISCSAAQ